MLGLVKNLTVLLNRDLPIQSFCRGTYSDRGTNYTNVQVLGITTNKLDSVGVVDRTSLSFIWSIRASPLRAGFRK